ncbi:MAG: hypothetical protein AMJ54_01740 [Deltaproteobacteria bacterium SG8_13]|nr:MAG: hypothetical protein AMJ54_01740 [Deltaproteobacteria bacterium SG8_13]
MKLGPASAGQSLVYDNIIITAEFNFFNNISSLLSLVQPETTGRPLPTDNPLLVQSPVCSQPRSPGYRSASVNLRCAGFDPSTAYLI